MSRQGLAYLLIGLIALAFAATIAWKLYYSRQRSLDRRRSRDEARWRRKAEENGHFNARD